MAADLNRVTLVGRLTRDPELRHTAAGDQICLMRLAVSSRARNDDGEWGDKPNFFDVTVFGRLADTASTYLAKGRRIGVDGRLAWREWTAQDGTRRQAVQVIANDLFFLDSQGGQQAQQAAQPEAGGMPVSEPPAATPPADDDDIPF